MARVRKLLATYGTHHSPDGPVTVTPERARHWVSQHAAMTAAGLKVPVPFGHQDHALPCDMGAADQRAYLASRFNAGYLERLEVTPEGVAGVLDLPALQVDAAGHLIDPHAGTAISEVSLDVGTITDGQRREWRDSVVHVALTPWPVVGDQGGFTALGLKRPASPQLVRLALSPGGFAVADEKKDEKGPPEKKAPDAAPDKPADDADGKGGFDLLGDGQPDPNQQLIAQLKQELSGMGLTLPDTTDGKDVTKFLEHMLVALSVIKSQKQAAAPPPKPADDPSQQPAKEEQPPQQMYMSLKQYKDDPIFRSLVDEKHKAACDGLAAKIDALAALNCSPPTIAKLKAYSRGARLSLAAKSVRLDAPVPMPTVVDMFIDEFSRMPEQARSWLAQSGAVEAPSPLDRDKAATVDAAEEVLDEMLASTGMKRRA